MPNSESPKRKARIFYARTDEFWRKGEKYAFLEEKQHVGGVEWQELQPDAKDNWLTEGMQDEFNAFMPIGSKEAKKIQGEVECIFKSFSHGNDSGRDDWVYNFDRDELLKNVKVFADTYNAEVDRWHRSGKPDNIDDFVLQDERRIKWTRNAKRDLRLGRYAEYSPTKVIHALYRPFSVQFLYSGKIFSKEVGSLPQIIPGVFAESENRLICVGIYGRKSFAVLATNFNPNLNLFGDPHQAFPFYTYDEDGTNRRENITDWALEKFRSEYGDRSLTKWDIFHYVYAVLHHPAYRERYAANLKRELPRIPLVGVGTIVGAGLVPARRPADATSSEESPRAGTSPAPTNSTRAADLFRAFVEAGRRLAELHTNYERQPEYPLERIEAAGVPVSWRVEWMRLSRDRQSIVYNDFLTLAGVPPEAFHYRLGNRSALEWVIDQYQLTTDRRSGITNDPNRADDPHYILRLVGQVITVSLETNALVRALPALGVADAETA